MMTTKIATIVGARPQFIKASVVSRAIRNREDIEEVLIHTGQHYDVNMSKTFFEELDIPEPKHNLGIGGGTHGQNTGRMLVAIEAMLVDERPDWALVYGDTDSTLAGALAAVKLHIPLAHVEAGLRSFNRRMPEEINRVLTDHAADLLFAPTETAVRNLAAEGILGNKVQQVGDVMYDAALYYARFARKPNIVEIPHHDFVLCTLHRAENTDNPERLHNILCALNDIACEIPIVLPLHPRTQQAILRNRSGKFLSNIHVIDPVGYLEMIWLLGRCTLVMTDSGGLQKEAFFHGKPCVTLRDETEWVELVEVGANKLSQAEYKVIISAYQKMKSCPVKHASSLYGNGDAARSIVDFLHEFNSL